MLVYFSVVLMLLLGFCGLAVDSGRKELRTLQLQGIADNASLSAAIEYSRANSGWLPAANNDVSSLASAIGLSGVAAAYQYTAPVGPYSNDHSAIQATVTQSMPLTFMSLLTHTTSTTVSASAVSVVPPCAYFTNPSGNSLWMASTGMSTSCPVYANNSVVVDYFATLNSMQLKVAGPAGSSNVSGNINPSAIYNAPALPDPLAYVVAPTFSACTPGATALVINSPSVAYPATYCGGVTVTNTTVFLQPGLYIITGGASISNSTITGSGVTLYFTQGGGYGFGTFRLGNHSVWHVNAPIDNSGGGIPGVVIMGDRAWSGGANDFQFDTSSYQADGIIYTTNTGMTDQITNMSGYNYFGVVTKYMYEYSSNFYPSANYASLPGGNPLHVPVKLVQ